MQLNKKRAGIVKAVIDKWQEDEVIDKETAEKLHSSIQVTPFDWKKAAAWCFRFAIVCFVIALVSLFASRWFMDILKILADLFSYGVGRFIISAAVTGLFYFGGFFLRKRAPERVFRNEALLFMAVLANAWAVGELGSLLSRGSGHFSLLLLLSCLMYGVIGYVGRSNLVWIFALISFGAWMGAETGYISGWGAYYFGMNYPLRFTLLGALMAVASLSLRQEGTFRYFFSSTLSVSLFYLFMALWLLSIFGNYGDSSWRHVKQIELFHWSLLFALASFAAIWLGLKLDIKMLRGYGVTFLGINLYTRFFEYFWDAFDKSIFFALLGLSLWLLAKKSEKIWLLTEEKFGRVMDD